MASVQELLAAQEAQKSPLIKLLEGAAGGYYKGQNEFYDNAVKLIKVQETQRQMEQQKKFQDELQQKLAAMREKQTGDAFSGVASPTSVPMPAQKLNEKWNQDEKGNLSKTMEFVDPKEQANYNPVQLKAISSGDAEKISSAFPDGVPEKVANLMVTAKGTGQFAGVQDGQAVIVNGKQHTVTKVPIGGDSPVLPTTAGEQQAKASKFASQMAESSKSFDNLTRNGFDPTSSISGITSVFPNAIQPKGVQAYEQLKNNWLSANLRDESGAVIGNQEYVRDERRYFPQAGDSPERIKQKARSRAVAEQAMAKEAGQFGVQRSTDTAPKIPTPGTVEDGHVFKGGDPSDPKNWEKVK